MTLKQLAKKYHEFLRFRDQEFDKVFKSPEYQSLKKEESSLLNKMLSPVEIDRSFGPEWARFTWIDTRELTNQELLHTQDEIGRVQARIKELFRPVPNNSFEHFLVYIINEEIDAKKKEPKKS